MTINHAHSNVPEDAFDHPLTTLVANYCTLYQRYRNDHIDLGNLYFYDHFGLDISGPEDWPYLAAIKYAVDHFKDALIVYTYDKDMTVLREVLPSHVGFVSWHVAYYEITQKTKYLDNLMKNSKLIMLVRLDGPSREDPTVINYLKSNYNGCLITIG